MSTNTAVLQQAQIVRLKVNRFKTTDDYFLYLNTTKQLQEVGVEADGLSSFQVPEFLVIFCHSWV